MDSSFVPLRLRSRHSRLAGTIPVGDIPQHLKRLGFAAGALVDRGNLYGAVEFHEQCLKEGIKPILGSELTCPRSGQRAGLIALTREGYAGLCRIISDLNLLEGTSLIEALERSPEGIAVLSGDMDYVLAAADILGKERVWVEIVANRLTRPAVRELLMAAAGAGLRALGSWEVLVKEPPDERIARVLAAIGQGGLFSEVQLEARRASLDDSLELKGLFAERPELRSETWNLAGMVDLTLEIGTPHFPYARPTRAESFASLDEMCREALPGKYNGNRAQARTRLDAELRVIKTLGLSDYFLVVRDIVAFAALNSIPASGRGSGAGSLVAYLLDITQVDPIAHDLVFERFLNEHRPDYPDLDIDLSWRRRDEVIDYVYDHFGTSHVAMILAHACFELRSAAREVAKTFGLTPAEAQAVSSRLPWRETRERQAVLERVLGEVKPELSGAPRRAIAELAASIVGFPHHSSVHCGGVVISDRPITDYTPLELAPKGIQVTQFDMHAIEKIGLVKIDLLGNRALTVIEEATRDVTARTGHSPAVDPDDPATARMLKAGRTMSCFHLESPAMRNLLAMLGAKDRDDAILAVALVRPGPSAGGMKGKFIERRSLPDGGRTRGRLPVYEEDVMRMISEATGMGLAEADLLRRKLKDGGSDEDDLREKFVFLAETAGTSRPHAIKVWEHVRRFAAYTFCKAHAASFGMISYASAYLKANHPLEFYAATLRNHAGMYPAWAHVNEARRAGVKILLPAVNRSRADFSIEGDVIRSGFGSVRHLSQTTIDRILKERALEPFWSLSDFLARVPAGKDEVAGLVASGAFDEIESDRCGALAGYLSLKGNPATYAQPRLGLLDCETRLPTRRFRPLQERRMEYSALGFSPLVHPLEFFILPDEGPTATHSGSVAARSPHQTRVEARRGLRRSPVGLLAAMRHYKSGATDIYFLTLDHPEGLHECIVSRNLLSRPLEIGKAYHVAGTTSERFGVKTVRIREIGALREKPV
ncbi:MAG: DNA polymerase III subunit alpha [Candidatus Eisenbacteria bacterium]